MTIQLRTISTPKLSASQMRQAQHLVRQGKSHTEISQMIDRDLYPHFMPTTMAALCADLLELGVIRDTRAPKLPDPRLFALSDNLFAYPKMLEDSHIHQVDLRFALQRTADEAAESALHEVLSAPQAGSYDPDEDDLIGNHKLNGVRIIDPRYPDTANLSWIITEGEAAATLAAIEALGAGLWPQIRDTPAKVALHLFRDLLTRAVDLDGIRIVHLQSR